ncbi:hypothetical protein [Sporichthya polymorpha]|uniref:hypothetical protein n=1 Tax=Sporichthya polymorpha TaxID=35751 RepID=UPI0003784D55|nr:hypothetical protein [Sporichthya polymorpha]
MSEALVAVWAALAARAEAQVAATAAAYSAGAVSRTSFVESAAASVYAANVAATSYADTAVAAWQLATVGLPSGALGLLPPREEQERLVRAFATLSAHGQAMARVQTRAARVAHSEPLQRGHRAYLEALRARGVEQWRRVVRPDACDRCAPLAGTIHPTEVDFTDHPGCRCSLAPVASESWADRQRERQVQLRRTWNTSAGQVRFSSGISIR